MMCSRPTFQNDLMESKPMFTEKFRIGNDSLGLQLHERLRFESATSETRQIDDRTCIIKHRQDHQQNTLLLEGIMCRYVDDRNGLRQLVAKQADDKNNPGHDRIN